MAVALLALAAFVFTPALSFADTVAHGGITIENPSGPVTGVTDNDPVTGMITITNTTNTLTLSGTTTNQFITVDPGAGNTTHLVLDGLNIDANATAFYNALTVLSGTLELTIAAGSSNELNGGTTTTGGGITLYNTADLTIDGTGTLTVRGRSSAGIGAGYVIGGENRPDPTVYPGTTAHLAAAGDITIRDITLFAYTQNGGAGIGGGYAAGGPPSSGPSLNVSAGNIILSDVTLTSEGSNAGIGAGTATYSNANASAGDITITGGTVTASVTDNGAGIGGGYASANGNASAGTITISDGEITSTGYNGAGIGGGYAASTNPDVSVKEIIITGGTIEASGGAGTSTAGIGDGYASSSGANASANLIDISGGIINATGATYAGAGIGGGTAASGTSPTVIRISGGTISLVRWSGVYGNIDLGNGYSTTIASITITGGSVSPASGAAGVAPQPTDGAGNNVYLNTYTLSPALSADTAITAGSINGVVLSTATTPTPPTYGINDVFTNTVSAVYLWLPATTSVEPVILRVGTSAYVDAFARPAGAVVVTLPLTDIDAPAAFIYPDGGTAATNPLVTNTAALTLEGLDETSAAASLVLHYYLDGAATAEVTQTGSPFSFNLPEGAHSVTYWATDAANNHTARATTYYLLDTTAPKTTPSVAGGSHGTVLAITLSATDPKATDGSSSGVSKTYYQMEKDGAIVPLADPTKEYTGQTITLNADGTYTLTYYSIDAAGNEEATGSTTYIITLASDGAGSGAAIPKTGDSTGMTTLALAALLATGGGAGLLVRHRRKHN